jgi:hypothetical protein
MSLFIYTHQLDYTFYTVASTLKGLYATDWTLGDSDLCGPHLRSPPSFSQASPARSCEIWTGAASAEWLLGTKPPDGFPLGPGESRARQRPLKGQSLNERAMMLRWWQWSFGLRDSLTIRNQLPLARQPDACRDSGFIPARPWLAWAKISSPTRRISYHDHDHPTILWTWAKALMYYRFLPTDLRLAGYTAAWQVVPGGSGDHVLDEPTACHVASCAWGSADVWLLPL